MADIPKNGCEGDYIMGDAVAKWLARWIPNGKVQVRVLAGSLCCVLGQAPLLSQCLSPPRSING